MVTDDCWYRAQPGLAAHSTKHVKSRLGCAGLNRTIEATQAYRDRAACTYMTVTHDCDGSRWMPATRPQLSKELPGPGTAEEVSANVWFSSMRGCL